MVKGRALTRTLIALTVIGNVIIIGIFGPGEYWDLEDVLEESIPVMLIFTFVIWVGSFFVGWILQGWWQDKDPVAYAAWKSAMDADASGTMNERPASASNLEEAVQSGVFDKRQSDERKSPHAPGHKQYWVG